MSNAQEEVSIWQYQSVKYPRLAEIPEACGLVKCSNPECNEMVKPHRVCKVCGFYDGKKVLDVKA